MYIRTKDGQVVKTFTDPYVMPLNGELWSLMVVETGSNNKVIVADFDSVSDANMALDDLCIAQTKKHGWDAIEYKNELARLRKNR